MNDTVHGPSDSMDNRENPIEAAERLTLDDVEAALSAADLRFQEMASKYFGEEGELTRTEIDEGDMEEMAGILGDTLPLSASADVQAQLGDATIEPEDLMFNRLSQFQMDVMTFAAQFTNSGVSIFESDSLFD